MELKKIPKIGLKLWSSNAKKYLHEASRLYEMKYFDYVELYVVPDTLKTIPAWKDAGIPYQIHAPHFAHGVNLSQRSKEEYNVAIYKQVAIFFEKLHAKYTIVHLGMGGEIEEAVRQLRKICPPEMLIENKPFRAPASKKLYCRGATIQEISLVKQALGCGFCLDIGHAICTANDITASPYEILESFQLLQPKCYHISDNYINSGIDRHLCIGEGEYDFGKIFSIIKNPHYITIETDKKSENNLDDFISDSLKIKRFFI